MKWTVDQTIEPSLVTIYNGFHLKMVSRGNHYVVMLGGKEVACARKKGDLYKMIRARLGARA